MARCRCRQPCVMPKAEISPGLTSDWDKCNKGKTKVHMFSTDTQTHPHHTPYIPVGSEPTALWEEG